MLLCIPSTSTFYLVDGSGVRYQLTSNFLPQNQHCHEHPCIPTPEEEFLWGWDQGWDDKISRFTSTLAWKIPWTEEPGGLQSMGSLRVGHDFHFSLSCIGEGNGSPLQYSCLENPMDGGAWKAAVHGVTEGQWPHDWATSRSLFTFMHWRRKWQPTPVFLPGESQGRGSLVGCRLWGRTELDTTETT